MDDKNHIQITGDRRIYCMNKRNHFDWRFVITNGSNMINYDCLRYNYDYLEDIHILIVSRIKYYYIDFEDHWEQDIMLRRVIIITG